MKTTTLGDIYKWLLEGKKVKRKTSSETEKYVYLLYGTLYNDNDKAVCFAFQYPHEWEIYEDEVKWYKITFQTYSHSRPCVHNGSLFKSKEEFLTSMRLKEEQLFFFHMEEVINQLPE